MLQTFLGAEFFTALKRYTRVSEYLNNFSTRITTFFNSSFASITELTDELFVRGIANSRNLITHISEIVKTTTLKFTQVVNYSETNINKLKNINEGLRILPNQIQQGVSEYIDSFATLTQKGIDQLKNLTNLEELMKTYPEKIIQETENFKAALQEIQVVFERLIRENNNVEIAIDAVNEGNANFFTQIKTGLEKS
jgi:hypothetical protein